MLLRHQARDLPRTLLKVCSYQQLLASTSTSTSASRWTRMGLHLSALRGSETLMDRQLNSWTFRLLISVSAVGMEVTKNIQALHFILFYFLDVLNLLNPRACAAYFLGIFTPSMLGMHDSNAHLTLFTCFSFRTVRCRRVPGLRCKAHLVLTTRLNSWPSGDTAPGLRWGHTFGFIRSTVSGFTLCTQKNIQKWHYLLNGKDIIVLCRSSFCV